MRLLWAIALIGILLTGCKHSQPGNAGGTSKNQDRTAEASGRSRSGASEKTRVLPVTDVVGKVLAVSANFGFVVIDFSFGRVPQPEQRFSIYRQGQKVGEVKISPQVRDNYVAADVVAGNARPGDEVRSF